MEKSEKLKAYIGDVWLELDDCFGSKDDSLVWLQILGTLQNKALTFELERHELGLPTDDADTLFVQKNT